MSRDGVCVCVSVFLRSDSSCVRPGSPGAIPVLNGVENLALPSGRRPPDLTGVIPRLLPFAGELVEDTGGCTGVEIAALVSTTGNAAGSLELEAFGVA